MKKQNDNCMVFRNDGNEEYHVRILMSKEQCDELKLTYPLEVDVVVYEVIGNGHWEEKMREEIENALFESFLPVDEDDFYQEACEAWFEEIAWNWELEEEAIVPAAADPFSDQNKEATLKAYRLLYFFMMQDGRKNEMNRVFQDETFAKRLFEEYHIGNLIMERKQLCQYTTI